MMPDVVAGPVGVMLLVGIVSCALLYTLLAVIVTRR